MEYHFIRCNAEHLAVLRKLSIRTFVDTYGHMNTPENVEQHIRVSFDKKQLQSELNDDSVFFYILYVGDIPAGYIKLNIADAQTESFGSEVIELERIYLLKEFQGKGCGRILINKSIEVGKSLGCSRMWLGVWKKNPEALGFYQKVGFKIFGEHIFKVGDDEQVDWMMDIYL